MAHATKRGKHWRCLVFSHYEYKDGKKVRRYKSFTASTRREAERLAAQYEYDRAHTPQTITVHDAIEQYISVKESALSPSTVTGYRSYFRTGKYELIEDMDVSTVDQRTLQLWVASMLDEEYAPKYIHNLYGLLRPALTMAGVGSIPITLPMVIMPDIYVPTDKELKTLLAYLDKNDRETKAAAMLAAFGSMRRSEICALKPSDFADNTVTVQRAIVRSSSGKWVEKKTNKTVKSHRTIVLPQQVIDGIDLTRDPLISLDPDQLSKRFRKAVKHANMPQAFCLHDLRHYYVSIAHVLGIPDAYVMKMGGWQTDYVMKRNYRTTLSDVEQREQDKLNKHFSKML
jgi:integrase